MKLVKRILSTLLAVTMILGTLVTVFTFGASAAPAVKASAAGKSESDYIGKNAVHKTPESKLATMQLMYTEKSGRYSLYADGYSGEIACVDNYTDEILFSNPYDVATVSNKATQYELLSQILITYVEVNDKDQIKRPLNSFKNAALEGQIKVQAIKKGIRVEYIIGQENVKRLIPELILEEDFEKNILGPLKEAIERGELTQDEYDNFLSMWQKKDANMMGALVAVEWEKVNYPFLKKYKTVDQETGATVYPVFYEIDKFIANSVTMSRNEDIIKKYTEYSLDILEEDHAHTEHVVEEKPTPAFKLALEYYADENGMTVRLPSNGIRYDMATYRLEDIQVLPFIGVGNYLQDGYAFFPDGSGALFDYDVMRPIPTGIPTVVVSGQVYGEDYAYHELQEMKYEKVIRYPVYGLISTDQMHTYIDEKGQSVTVSNTVQTKDSIIEALQKAGVEYPQVTTESHQRGFFAIVEEADSMASLELLSGGSSHKYATIRNHFNPRPNDLYDLSSTGGGSMTVVLDRKYTGSITIRFTMLCDENIAAEAKKEHGNFTTYPTTWMGMATAYRNYLTDNGVLSPLKKNEVKEDIPLYIESFGALETQETFATIPIYVMTPLTTFENIMEMYNSLAENDVKNINFKMTGFANGGMYYEVPSALNWENAVGGKDGFQALVDKSKEINKRKDGSHLGLFPDFDFAYIQTDNWFDAVNLDDDAIKTIDNRYTAYRQYSPTNQTFVTFYQLAISPSRYSKFYTELLKNYEQYGLKSISVATLGSALNSDFDEEDPYVREDGKNFTVQALSYIQKKGYSIMTDGGNAYTWSYVDHMLNVDLDSSRYLESSASVPFIGTVLHGSVQFAGTPLNEEGDANYAMLRAIENGAAMYFLLSYQNTAELKNDPVLSQYYSIRYDIWEDDVIAYYKQLNDILKDVQTKFIIDHEFLVGERILDLDELQASIQEKLEAAEKKAAEDAFNRYNGEINSISDAWNLLYTAEESLSDILSEIKYVNTKITEANAIANVNFGVLIRALNTAHAEMKVAESALNDEKEQLEIAKTALAAATEALNTAKAATEAAQAALDAAEESEKPAAQLALEEAQLAQAEKQTAYDACEGDVTRAQEKVDVAQEALDEKTEAYQNDLTALTAALEACYPALVNLVDYRIRLDELKADAAAIEAAIPVAFNKVETTTALEGAEGEAIRASFLAQMNGFLTAITDASYFAQIHAAYNTYSGALDLTLTDSNSIFASAIANLENTFVNDQYGMINFDELSQSFAQYFFDSEMLAEVIEDKTFVAPTPAPDATVEEVANNNRVVAVTYGTGNDPYKTFILNYNSYTVRVTYGGKDYTIASGACVVVEHTAKND